MYSNIHYFFHIDEFIYIGLRLPINKEKRLSVSCFFRNLLRGRNLTEFVTLTKYSLVTDKVSINNQIMYDLLAFVLYHFHDE